MAAYEHRNNRISIFAQYSRKEAVAQRYYRPWIVPVLLLSTSLFVVALFLWAEYIQGLKPCILCLYQRIPWYFMLVLVVCWMAEPGPKVLDGLLIGVAGASAVSLMLSLYHVGVEYGWWGPPLSCRSPSIPTAASDLATLLRIGDFVDCRRVAWRLPFDISAAWGNLLASAVMLMASIVTIAAQFWVFLSYKSGDGSHHDS